MIMMRADANRSIATGHLMRTLTIAQECIKRKEPVWFLLADRESEAIFRTVCPRPDDYRVVILAGDYRCPEAELPVLDRLLAQEKPRAMLVDSYFVTEKYLRAAGRQTKIFYLDDVRKFDYPVDVVINYDIIAREDLPGYRDGYAKARKRLLGPAYAPLREQFRQTGYRVKETVADLLITTGGSDEDNLTEALIEAAGQSLDERVIIHAVIGPLNRHRDRLREKAAHQKHLKIYEGVSDLAGLMAKCDLALSAAGTTLYELAAVGVPTVCFTIADNQVSCAEGFAAGGAVIYEKGRDFAGQLKALAADYPRRGQMSAAMRELIDGRGAGRIAGELCAIPCIYT